MIRLKCSCVLKPTKYEVEFDVTKEDGSPATGAVCTMNGISGTTDGSGVAVLSPYTKGNYAYTVELAGDDKLTGTFTVA